MGRLRKKLVEEPGHPFEEHYGGECPGVYYHRLQPVGSGCYYDTHRRLHPESGTVLNHPEWEWAELDRKRLVWVTKGVLYAAEIHGTGVGDAKVLHDFNEMEFEEIPAPY